MNQIQLYGYCVHYYFLYNNHHFSLKHPSAESQLETWIIITVMTITILVGVTNRAITKHFQRKLIMNILGSAI